MDIDEILKFDFNAKYNDSLVEFKDGVDILPSLLEFYECGLGDREHDKLFLLLRIESLKQDFSNEDNCTEEERKEHHKCINTLIDRYNKM